MPTYNIFNKKTKKTEEMFMSWNDLQGFLVKNPHLNQAPSTPAIVSGVTGVRKIDNGFKDVLHRIKSNNRGSTVRIPR